MKIIIKIIISLSFISCENSSKYNEQTYSVFPNEITPIKKDIILTDSVYFNYPIIKVIDSLCVFFDYNNSGKLFHVFTYPEFKYIYSVGSEGRGNNEIDGAVEFDLTNEYLYVYATDMKRIFLFDIKNKNNNPCKIIPIDEYKRPYDFTMIDSSKFVFSLIDGDYRMRKYAINGQPLDSMLKIPKTDYGDILKSGTVWSSKIDYNNNRIVMATIGGEVINIINNETNEETTVVGPGGKPEPQKNGEMYDYSRIYGFSNICLTKKYIYCLFSGVKTLDYFENKLPLNWKIYVYDYDGNPVKKININVNNIISMYVDDDKNKIYITTESENPVSEYEI